MLPITGAYIRELVFVGFLCVPHQLLHQLLHRDLALTVSLDLELEARLQTLRLSQKYEENEIRSSTMKSRNA